jgi:hypothetical protein
MKYIFSLLLIWIMTACNSGPRPEDAVKFNDSVVFRQDTLYMMLDEFITLIEQEAESQLVEEKYAQTLKYAEKALQYVENIDAFDEEDEMRKASVKYFQKQIDIFNNEFSQILSLYTLDPSEITTEMEHKWDSLMANIILLDSMAAYEFLQSQQIFAEKYGITLKDID